MVDEETRYQSRSGRRASDHGLLSISLDDYLRLLDWTGRQLRHGKRGAIPKSLAPILDRLSIREETMVDTLDHFYELFGHVVGQPADLEKAAAEMGVRWLKGQRASRQLFN